MKITISKIIKVWLLVGTLDILAAFTMVFVKSGKNPLIVLNFIASAIFGSDAYKGGGMMQLIGLICHFLIALFFTVFFYLIYPRIKLLRHNVMLTGFTYGLFIWCVMNLLVMPSTKIPDRPFDVTGALINMLILITCIGIPLAVTAKKTFQQSSAIQSRL